MTKSDDEAKARPEHSCAMPAGAVWAQAIEYCQQDDEGQFYVGNGEYSSYVNFCPFCGEKAPKPIPMKQ